MIAANISSPPHSPSGKTCELHTGDCLEAMRAMPDASIDAIVCDPPYGLGKEPDSVELLRAWTSGEQYQPGGTGFMSLAWDAFVPGPEVWREALRVLKPGGHLVAFFGTRTYDLGALAIRIAGFEIRDQLMWVYANSMPKAKALSGDWTGWWTGLKPAHEPICLARRPFAGSVAENARRYGTGALNIEACRVELEVRAGPGRWPSNLAHDGSPEVLGAFPEAPGQLARTASRLALDTTRGSPFALAGWRRGSGAGTNGATPREDATKSAARFFYCAKASRKDRNEGLEDPGPQFKHGATLRQVENATAKAPKGNFHPTVKPTELMRWLCRLVTPPGGMILDPYMGSGSTGKAAVLEGFSFVGIERDPAYAEIARKRIAWAQEELWKARAA